MLDMSATLVHHGHVRLINKAAKYGDVVIGLTTDDEIESKRLYPELNFESRKEILEAMAFVKEVVPTPWLINDEVLNKYKIDLLIHGDDNSNIIPKEKLLLFPRTEGISSMDIRHNVGRSLAQIRNRRKLMLTPGPGSVPYEATREIRPLFGRGDGDYTQMSSEVIKWIKGLSGQDEVVVAQGSATFGLGLAAHTFVRGKVLLVSTGYYSNRLEELLPSGCEVTKCQYVDAGNLPGDFDWVMCTYTETSCAFKVDLEKLRKIADSYGASLYVDATASIGLEDRHELADVLAFSSCKGLFGITGAAFVAYKHHLKINVPNQFYLNIQTHRRGKLQALTIAWLHCMEL